MPISSSSVTTTTTTTAPSPCITDITSCCTVPYAASTVLLPMFRTTATDESSVLPLPLSFVTSILVPPLVFYWLWMGLFLLNDVYYLLYSIRPSYIVRLIVLLLLYYSMNTTSSSMFFCSPTIPTVPVVDDESGDFSSFLPSFLLYPSQLLAVFHFGMFLCTVVAPCCCCSAATTVQYTAAQTKMFVDSNRVYILYLPVVQSMDQILYSFVIVYSFIFSCYMKRPFSSVGRAFVS